MEGSALRRLAQELGKASAVLSKEAVSDVMKMCEVLKRHLQRKVAALLAKAAGRPVLFSYSADSTPMKVAVRLATEPFERDATGAVQRRGRSCVEFHLQRGWYKTIGPDGDVLIATLLREPIPLTSGKTSWHLFSAAQEFACLTQDQGHTGICITHYAFDRAVFSALSSKLSQRHELSQERRGASVSSSSGIPASWLDWTVATGCALHDAQNGLKWALAPFAGSGDLVRDLHITIESLRNAFLMLHSHLGAFLQEANIGFDHEPYDRDQVYEFWVALGVGGDVVDIFVDLNPWFSEGRLWVSGQWEGHPQLEERLAKVIVYLLKLKRFTESRWCTIGPSCRALVGCLSVGLELLVAVARKSPQTSDFYIAGFSRLSSDLKQYAALASIASYVPDAFLQELLEDDRIASRLTVFETAMLDELGWLDRLSPLSWQRLASVIGSDQMPWRKLRTDVLLCAQVACSYTTDKVLSVARGFPWCLARGDVEEKLSGLALLSKAPEDDTAQKIHRLLLAGHQWVVKALLSSVMVQVWVKVATRAASI
jgi:hypothetical protein